MLRLSEEELSQAYYRASQIVEQQADAGSDQIGNQDYQQYLAAAEEAGVPRPAMLQALRERFVVPTDAIKPGDILFAPAADKAWHAASVIHMDNATSVIVRFLTGGEQSVSVTDLRPLGLVPGREVEFDYKVVVPEMQGIWHRGKVAEYDAETQKARVIYGITPYTVPLTRLRLPKPKQQAPPRVRTLLFRAVLIAGSVGGSWLLARSLSAVIPDN